MLHGFEKQECSVHQWKQGVQATPWKEFVSRRHKKQHFTWRINGASQILIPEHWNLLHAQW